MMFAMRLLTRLALKTDRTDVDDQVVQTLSGPVLLLVFGYGVIQSLRVLEAMPDWVVDNILHAYEVLVAVIVVYLAYKIFRLVFVPMTAGIYRRRKQEFDRTVFDLFESVGA
ncbi:MAG: hypothetical protein GWN18_03490, partial [Thermoplasmata archaeon]|nr:hypothetical protein [Thermoplasmata archaeon]